MAPTHGELFKQYIENKGISDIEVALKLKKSSVQIGRYYKTKQFQRPTLTKIREVFKDFTVNNSKYYQDEQKIIHYTKELPAITSDKISSPPIIESPYNAKQVFGSSVPNMYIIPLKAYGGFLSGYEKKVFSDSIQKVPFPLVKGECYSFEVDGSSMRDEFCPGDYFVGVPLEAFTWMVKGKPYVFQTVDGLILKCFEKIENDHACLYSTNPDYNPVKPIYLKDIKAVYHKEFVIKK